jgi:GTP-binding protein
MEYAPIIPLCAKDGSGVDKLLDTALRMYRQLRRRTETSALNAALERWLEEAPPPQGPRTRFKVKYAVQVSPAAATTPTAATAPDSPAAEESRRGVKFVFFVSRPAAVTDAYKAYLRNKIRKDLGYSMIPVEIEIRPSRKERR